MTAGELVQWDILGMFGSLEQLTRGNKPYSTEYFLFNKQVVELKLKLWQQSGVSPGTLPKRPLRPDPC